jgi:tRNA pseudouridine38-40 synthase
MRYLARLKYNGSDFCGWQIQPNSSTVQEVIEGKLSMLLNEDVKVIGCGRTDTGVHARDFYLHFDTENIGFEAENLKYKLNSVLPSSIAMIELRKVSDEFHARFSAISRQYKYYINLTKDPFKDNFWFVRQPLDLRAMREASSVLMDYEDFTSFSKLHTDAKTNLCKITQMDIEGNDIHIVITITANRFLRNMVRAIVGTLVEIGLGKRPPQDMKRIIEAKNRCEAGSSAPAKGLFLNEIKYPSKLIEGIE